MSSVVDDIRRVYAEEEAKNAKALTLADVPHNYRAITPQWLTAVLCRQTPGAEVTGLRLGEASDGSSNRQRIHVTYNEAGEKAGLPPSVFCKASQTLLNRIMLGSSRTAEGETHFFNKVRDRLPIETPVPLHAAFDKRTHAYIVVMQDMTDTAIFCDETVAISRAEAEEMVRVLARLHATFYESPELGTETLPFHHWSDWWTNMMDVAPDFAEKCDIAFGDCEHIIPARLFARRKEVWPRTMESAALHRNLPRSIIHCDVHLRNWYKRSDRMGLCDWQITNVGHWSRDFVYAMSTSLSVANRRAWLDDLLRLYLSEAAALGVPAIPFEQAKKLCRQQLLSTLAFWTITLRPAKDMPPMQPDSLTLCLIERIVTAMDDLDALDAFD